jgi:GNAT superfamily N-acetyltransferase
MHPYRFERLNETNLHHLIRLYNDCFGLKISLSFLQKKYNTTAFGSLFIGFIAFENETNELAGYYGVFPISCSLNGKKIKAAQSGDTMTHPKHQGKGLFTQLAKATYELAASEGMCFVYGFPNKNSYRGLVKLNWNFYNEVNCYTLKTGVLPFDKLAKKINAFSVLYQAYVKNCLSPLLVDTYFENSIPQQNPGTGYVVHDPAFFAYKTYYTFYRIKINNTNCVIKIDGKMWIGDIAYSTKADYLKTVAALLQLAKKLGCATVQFSLFNGTFYDKIMQEHYPVTSKLHAGFFDLNKGVAAENFAYQALDFDTY